MKTRKYVQPGFTLVELMIVVAVVAILAVIAYPSYDEYIRRSRMEDARAALIENIQVMERHYGRKNTFCAAVKNDGSCAGFPTLPEEETRFYRLAVETNLSSADNFVLSAVPQDGVYSDEKQVNNPLAIYYSSLNGSFFKCKKGADFDNDVGCENF